MLWDTLKLSNIAGGFRGAGIFPLDCNSQEEVPADQLPISFGSQQCFEQPHQASH